jgi:polyhydroxybutyrate depolymerase
MNTLLSFVCLTQVWLVACRGLQERQLPGEECRFELGKVERSYRVYRPEKMDAKQPVPVVFAFHGGAGDAKQAQGQLGLDALARQKNFMVVYPEALNGHWNDGRKSERFAEQDASIDDVAYFRALLAKLRKEHGLDTERIYALGVSNGGMFVQRLALQETRTFAAVASVISSLPEPLQQGFMPKAPLSVLFMSGTEDPIIPYKGGEVVLELFGLGGGKSRGHVLGVEASAKLWALHNGAKAQASTQFMPDIDPADGTRVRRHLWAGGKAGAPEVLLYQVLGGGHTLPQLGSKAPERLVGKSSGDLKSMETIWHFFENKRRLKAE